jgi:succinoglycan biosynthesis transport protein ExoP
MNALTRRESVEFAGPKALERIEFDLLWCWRAIYRRKWPILLIVVLVGILAAMYASGLPPLYRSTATVMVQEGRKKVVSNEELYDATVGTSRDYYATQFEVMKSRDFAERLVRVLNLANHPELNPRIARNPWYHDLLPDASQVPDWIPNALLRKKPAPIQMSEEDARDAATARVMSRLSFQPVRNTQIIRVGFESGDPVLAERVPNTLAYIYIVADLEARSESTRQAMSFITSQSEALRRKLTESEKALQEFRERQRIVVNKGITLSSAARKVEDLTGALAEARRKRTEMETVYKAVTAAAQQASPDGLESLTAVQTQPVLMRLKEAELEAQKRVKELSQRYGNEHPRMIAANSELKAAQESVRRQLASVVQTLQKDFEVAKANEASIEHSLSLANADAQAFNRVEFPLQRLEREAESDRQIYNQFMQRSRDMRAGDIQAPIARIVDYAILPKAPFGPNKRQAIAVPMLIAFLIACALALLLERLDNTVRTGDEVEMKLDSRMVGLLQRSRPKDGIALERMVLEDNRGTFSEAIRTIRSDVTLSSIDSKQKTILLTSAVPDEGKTTVACNLALSFAQVKKTLLIEADMRRPKLARIFGLHGDLNGLSDLIAGEASFEQCIHQVEDSNLFVLPTGHVPPAPLELLSSNRYVEVMDALQETYEVIIIDTPPVHLFSDALVLSKFATTVLFVVKADATPYPVSRNCLIRLARANAPVLGVVLNQLDLDKVEKYYRTYGHYYYGGQQVAGPAKAESAPVKVDA